MRKLSRRWKINNRWVRPAGPGSGTPGGGVAQETILLSASSIAENATIGSTVGALSVANVPDATGWTFTKTADPDNKFAILGSNLNTAAALDFETAQFHSVTVQATKAGQDTITRTFSIAVTNVLDGPTLAALTLPGTAAQNSTINISGATAGSTITGTMPAGWTLDGTARTIAITSNAPLGSQSWTLIETLADSPNSPRSTNGSLEVLQPNPIPALFAGGVAGAWFDPSDLSTVWQDSAGTIAGAVNQPVGRIDDKSGNGNHAVQATAAARPILRLDAETGTYYLETDGVDDRLVAPISVAAKFERVTVARQISWRGNNQLWATGSTGLAELRQAGAAPGLVIISSGSSMAANNDLPVGTNGIICEKVDGAARSLSLQINNGTPRTNATSINLGAQTSMALGARTGGTLAGNFRIYETVVRSDHMTTEQLDGLKTYFADRYGVTL